MAFDQFLAGRISTFLRSQHVSFETKKMMGGLIFMVNNKMCCGIHIDNKYGDSLLMAKIGEDQYHKEISKKECLPMDFTGRPMKGFIFITPEGFDLDTGLAYWVQKSVDYNHQLFGKKSL